VPLRLLVAAYDRRQQGDDEGEAAPPCTRARFLEAIEHETSWVG
jgi:hypothetical protein